MEKRILKKISAVVLAVVVVVSLVPVMRQVTNVTFGQIEAKAAGVVDRGSFGDNVTWISDDEGVLTIAGSGATENNDFGTSPFYSNESVRKVVIEEGTTSIGSFAFQDCSNLESVKLPNSLTLIDSDAFRGCSSLTSIEFPDGLTYIGPRAFMGCGSLASIEIPSSLTTIDMHVFRDCNSLTSIAVDSGNITYDSRGDCNAIIETETNILLYGCQNTTIPDGVTIIGEEAFDGRSNLTSIEIPDSVTRIEFSAFEGCSSLKSIMLPNSITDVGEDAFGACSNLADVYYTGTEEEWNAITIENGNDYLKNATIHYADEETGDSDTVSITFDPGNEHVFSPDETNGFIHYNSDITTDGTIIISAKADQSIFVNCSYYWPYDSTGQYYAVGWKLKGDDSGKIYTHGETYSLGKDNVTFEAVWKKKCVVTYDYNGGERTVTHVNRAEDEDYELYSGGIDSGCTSFGRSGFSFKGWQIKGSTDGKIYQKGDVYHLTGDVTFVAIWECKSHTWDTGKITKAPTTTATGVKTYTCTVCGETKTELLHKCTFKDVIDPTAFYYDPIYWAVDNSIVAGWSDGTFRPMNEANRAAVVTFLWRMKGKPEPKKTADFKDMTGNAEFDKAISWASENGIVKGWDDNTFRPWQTCNRAAIVTFLWRYAGKPTVSSKAGFKDMTGNSDFDKAISWAASKGITTGWNDNTFRPWDTCKRLAIVSFLNRYANE